MHRAAFPTFVTHWPCWVRWRLCSLARHFYLTKDPDRLPEYGSHVVAVLLQEERCKVPAYALQVGAVIRNLSDRPYLGFRPRPTSARLARRWASNTRAITRCGCAPSHASARISRECSNGHASAHPPWLSAPGGAATTSDGGAHAGCLLRRRHRNTFLRNDYGIGYHHRRRWRAANCGASSMHCARPVNGRLFSTMYGPTRSPRRHPTTGHILSG